MGQVLTKSSTDRFEYQGNQFNNTILYKAKSVHELFMILM